MTGNEHDALDATQEALLTIVRRLDRFDGRSTFGTWAYRVATNACLDELRRRRRRPEPLDPEDFPPRRFEGDPAGWIADRITLDDALTRLSTDFRAVLVLRELVGLEYAEIAETLDLPLGTVRSRLARARLQLGTALRDPAHGNPDPPGERRTPGDQARPDTTP